MVRVRVLPDAAHLRLPLQIEMDTQQARQTLADIEARHEDIMKLEKSIKEVHDLFVDMATLIEKQGDKIDSIENHVMNTRSCVEKAVEQTSKALVYQGKARTVSQRRVTRFVYHKTRCRQRLQPHPAPLTLFFCCPLRSFPEKADLLRRSCRRRHCPRAFHCDSPASIFQ